MSTEQERAEFEAWHEERYGEPAGEFKSSGFYDNHEVQAEWRGWQARATLQSQPLIVDALAQEIRRVDGSHSLGAGALSEALMPFIQSALQSQDAEDALSYRALVASGHFVPAPSPYFSIWGLRTTGGKASKAELDEAIDHARRVEGEGE